MGIPNQPVNATPPATSTPTGTVPTVSTTKSIVKELWGKYSIFFIIVGALLIVAKYSDIAMDILGWKSKKDVQDAQKTDNKLKAEENAANSAANDLIKQAQELPKTEGKVDDDWFKKRS